MNLRLIALLVAALVLACLIGSRNNATSGEPQTGGKLILSAPLTHSDWVLKDNVPGLDDGLAGVRHMLDMCQAAGWSRIYWRCLDAGRSLYPSKLMDPMGPPHGDNYFNPKPEEVGKVGAQKNEVVLQKMKDRYHYGTIDSLAEAVRYGHEIGLEIHAWFSINEDDHAWGWPSRYTVAHPEHRWKRRDGELLPQPTQFRPSPGAQLQAGDHPGSPRQLPGGRHLHRLDPHWGCQGPASGRQWRGRLRLRGHPGRGFRGEIRDRSAQHPQQRPALGKASSRTANRVYEVGAETGRFADSQAAGGGMVQHPWSYRGDNPKYADNLQGLLLDVETWAQEGLMDAAVSAGYYAPGSGGTPELAYEHLKKLTGGKTDIWMYAWVPGSVDEFLAGLERARKLGAVRFSIGKPTTSTTTPRKRNCRR